MYASDISECAVQLDLRISCTKIPSRDWGSKSDPFCLLLEKDMSGVWKELGRTEVVLNSAGVAHH
jgi:copine 1/2/3